MTPAPRSPTSKRRVEYLRPASPRQRRARAKPCTHATTRPSQADEHRKRRYANRAVPTRAAGVRVDRAPQGRPAGPGTLRPRHSSTRAPALRQPRSPRLRSAHARSERSADARSGSPEWDVVRTHDLDRSCTCCGTGVQDRRLRRGCSRSPPPRSLPPRTGAIAWPEHSTAGQVAIARCAMRKRGGEGGHRCWQARRRAGRGAAVELDVPAALGVQAGGRPSAAREAGRLRRSWLRGGRRERWAGWRPARCWLHR
jgi:hypothetical protein